MWANINDNAGPVATIFDIVNVTCNGGNDGAASVGVAGGTGPFLYEWTPYGGTGPTATGLVAGTYTVTVTDNNGCISNATTSPDILEPPPIVIDFSTTDVLCFGGSDGSVETTVTGGTPGYTYSWSPGGATTSDVTGLAAGTYTLTVTDLNLCVTSDVVTVTQPATAVTVSAVATPVSCSGGSDGTVSALASGGNPPFIYSWSPGGFSGSSAGSLTAGSYTVTATDLNGCVATATAVVTQPAPLALVTGSNNASCGGPTGLAFVTTSGGTTPYSYFWTPGGSTNDTASSLMPGTYTVSVTDNNSCNTTATVVVNNNPGPSVAITDVTNVSCFGGTDGTVTATVTGGAAPFIYSWAPAGGSGPVATGLSAGSYTVTVIDQNGCEASVITFPGVTQPPPIVLTITSDDVSCTAGSDGTASVTGSGGTPPFSYVWMPSLATGSSISGLAPGTYTVQATDANNCTQQNTFVIGEPAPLAASISSSIPVSCFGGSNGSATAAGSGGTLPYSYNWLPYGGTAATATGLAAGSYTVTITDAQGCTSTAIASITEPVSALSASATGSSTSCAAGSDATATVFPSGGTPGYTYLWTPTGQTASTATGLSAGIYNVLVTDANGCQTNASATITQPPGITATLTTVNPSCGFSNGSITTAVSGGTGAYSYLWSPGGATSANVTGLAPGTYTVTITDAEGCSSPFTAVLTNIPGPSVAISSSVPVSCNGGNDGFATVSISAGTTPYTMIWLPYGGTAATATGLVAGSYTVTVTDGLGCESSAVANITEPSLVSLSIASSSNVLCSAGASGNATVSASGGTPPYLYSWSTGATGATVSGLAAGTYTATATDANNCSSSISVVIDEPDSLMASMTSIITPSCFNSTNGSITASVTGGTIPYSFLWSDGQTGSTATGLAAGSYSVAVTDANGCTTSASFVLTQPTQIITIAGGNDTICLGSSGTLTATATGGSGGYYYAWQPGSVINSGTFNVNPPSNTTYTVVAYDADGCAGTPDTVSAIVYNLTEANIQALALSPICPGQSTVVYAEAYGSTGPLTYSWNNGLGSGPGGFLVTPSTEITYVVTVTNACGASIQDSVSITFNPPPAIAMSSDTNSVCAPGTIQFYDSSSTGNISDPITSWLWNFGDGTTSTLQNPEHTYSSPGIYGVTLTVTTLGGCNNTNSSTPYIVQVHPYPTAAFTVSSSTLNLPYDALVTTNLSTGATTYYWDFGDGSSSTSTNPVHNYNAVGIYPVTLIATSAYGCSDTAYTTITTTADVVFPNVFTPGGNGPTDGGYDPNSFDNDVFFPYTSGVVKFRLEIYNRWGELIFVSTDIRKGWDGYYKGELCQQDVYVWKADIELNDGKTFNKSGDVTLLR
jgi:PKD repeat protein